MNLAPLIRPFRRVGLGTFPTPGVLPFAALLWLALLVVVVGVTFAVDHWGTVDTSGWERANQLIRWGLLFLGAWAVYTYLPAYVAHGVTRRSFAERTAAYVVVLAALVAALSVVGFAVEGVIYDLRDWPHRLSDEHLFDSPDDLAVIFASQLLLFSLWIAVGALNAAAAYRDEGAWILATIPLSAVLLASAEAALDGAFPRIIDRVLGFLDDVPVGVGVATWAACLAVAGAATWALLRDIPIRPKQT